MRTEWVEGLFENETPEQAEIRARPPVVPAGYDGNGMPHGGPPAPDRYDGRLLAQGAEPARGEVTALAEELGVPVQFLKNRRCLLRKRGELL